MRHCFKLPKIKRNLHPSKPIQLCNARFPDISPLLKETVICNQLQDKKHQKPYLRFLQIHNSQNSPENHITEQTCKNISRWFVVLFDNIHHRRTWKKLTSDFIRKQGERSRYVYHQWFSNDFLGLSRDLSVDASLISGFIIKSLSCSMFNLVWMTEYEKGWGFFSELMKENISWLGITINWK